MVTTGMPTTPAMIPKARSARARGAAPALPTPLRSLALPPTRRVCSTIFGNHSDSPTCEPRSSSRLRVGTGAFTPSPIRKSLCRSLPQPQPQPQPLHPYSAKKATRCPFALTAFSTKYPGIRSALTAALVCTRSCHNRSAMTGGCLAAALCGQPGFKTAEGVTVAGGHSPRAGWGLASALIATATLHPSALDSSFRVCE